MNKFYIEDVINNYQVDPPVPDPPVPDPPNPEIDWQKILDTLWELLVKFSLYIGIACLVLGILYAFFGKRFNAILQGTVCALFGFGFFYALTIIFGASSTVALIVGLVTAISCGWCCGKALRL